MRLVRGQLKHSWLENQVLATREDGVVSLWRQGPWALIEDEFEARLDQGRQLAKEMVEAFSPAGLVDDCRPLSALPREWKAEMRSAVTQAYLQQSQIEGLRMELIAAIPPLESAVTELRGAWQLPRSGEAEQAVRSAWRVLRKRAETLCAVLDRMPRGTYLP